MGKKSKRTPPTHVRVEVATLEYLMDTIIAEYMQTTLVPGGTVVIGPRMSSDGSESISLKSHTNFSVGCPQNLSDFISSATASGQVMKPSTALAWWARSRLRYSCSTITTTFVRYMVPYMKTIGLTEIRSLTTGCNIRMDDLEVFSLGFSPNESHAIVLKNALDSLSKVEIVENLLTSPNLPPLCHHNVLKCRESGILIDITLGQFLGTMEPHTFKSVDEYFSQIPGQVLYFEKTGEISIDEQVSRDNAVFRSMLSPDSKPANFTKRVFRSCQEEKTHCWNCRGCASLGSSLKRCTKCQHAMYCSRQCQVLHWKAHKQVCSQPEH